jgi:hypothetical protein
MSKEPKQKAGATWHGFVPDTDPRYSSGWNYLSGKNLTPKPPEREPVSAAPNAAPLAPDGGKD